MMEFIGTLILIWLGIWLLGAIANFIGSLFGSATKAIAGEGSFKENMDLSLNGMGALEAKLKTMNLNDDGTGPVIKEISGKGLLPIKAVTNLSFITSVFDATSGEYEAVISSLDSFQEADSPVYQHEVKIGKIDSDQGFISWVRLGVIIPDILQPPYGGERKMVGIIRMIDMDNPPEIRHGFHTDEETIWTKSFEFTHTFEEKGYKEETEHREESMAVAVKIGVALAFSDGAFSDSEGEVLKGWISKAIEPFSEEKQADLKKLYNTALKEAYADGEQGKLVLSELTARLHDIGEKSTKYDALELCFEIMVADGIADKKELEMIRGISDALDLDMDEVEKMRDQKIIALGSGISEHASIETILGIEKHWSNDEVKKYLREEFKKWNNRLNQLTDKAERDNAQLMLERISEARKKYA